MFRRNCVIFDYWGSHGLYDDSTPDVFLMSVRGHS